MWFMPAADPVWSRQSAITIQRETMRFKKRLAACQRLVQSFVITGVMAAMSSWAIASEMPEPGHKSMVVVDGYFQYHYGAWATYTIHDLTTDEESTIFFSTLERKPLTGSRQCGWR